MCRIGGTHVRPVLYMAAVAITHRAGPMGDFYRRLVAAGKPRMVAIGALMRKLVMVMRSVLIRNKPFEPGLSSASSLPERPARPEGHAVKVLATGMVPKGSCPAPGRASASAPAVRPIRPLKAGPVFNP